MGAVDDLGADTLTVLGEPDTDEVQVDETDREQAVDSELGDTAVEWPPAPPFPATPTERRAQVLRAISEND
jgi:hypothetical protein